MKHNFYGKYKNILLRPLDEDDIEKLRIWRNDTVATRFLRPVGFISSEMQKEWYANYLNDKDIYTFAIVEEEKLNRMIGSVAIYNFRGVNAEIGKIQIGDSDAHGMGIGKKTLVIAMKIAFELLKIKTIDGVVHQENIAAHKNDMSIGFKVVSVKESVVGGFEDVIEIDYDRLKEVNNYVSDIKVGLINE